MRTLKAVIISGTSRGALRRRMTSVLAMAAILAAIFALPAFAQNTYIITDGANVIVHTTNTTDMRKIISEAGLSLGESDTYTTQETDGVSEIIINRVKMVTVEDGGQLSILGAYGGTVADVLDTLRISLGEDDRISCDLLAPVSDGMHIEITRVRYETVEYDKVLPYETIRYESSALSMDEEQTLVQGSDGLVHIQARITYENGAETARSILSEQVLVPATDQIQLYSVDRSVKEQIGQGLHPSVSVSGTSALSPSAAPTITSSSEGGVITTASGSTLTYSKVLNFKATAYTCEGYTGHTFSGTVARVGAIAVDPKVIPLGTQMYIVSDDGQYTYGYCVAEDTGGLIKGNRVDLYFDTYDECINFGYRPVTIYVLD